MFVIVIQSGVLQSLFDNSRVIHFRRITYSFKETRSMGLGSPICARLTSVEQITDGVPGASRPHASSSHCRDHSEPVPSSSIPLEP